MNYLEYPTKTMKLTQHHGEGNHKNHSCGVPADYPFDECCGDTGRGGFYCPCDEMRIVKLYTAGINTVWMTSTTPVVMPYGKAYVTIMVEHMEDEDMKKLAVGQTFKRGELMFYEGKDGATGNHFHISVGSGQKRGGGWTKNSRGAWVLTVTGQTLTAQQAFFVKDTEIINDKCYNFTERKSEMPKDNKPDGYAAAAVAWAIQQKILQGDNRGDQKLHQPITRQDVIVMLHRAIKG